MEKKEDAIDAFVTLDLGVIELSSGMGGLEVFLGKLRGDRVSILIS